MSPPHNPNSVTSPHFPPGFPPTFPPTNYIWHPSRKEGSLFSPNQGRPTFIATQGDSEGDGFGFGERVGGSEEEEEYDKAKREVEEEEYLLLFLPGNPGLMGYYDEFLGRLAELLQGGGSGEEEREDEKKADGKGKGKGKSMPISILGISHAGFYVSEAVGEHKSSDHDGISRNKTTTTTDAELEALRRRGYKNWKTKPKPWSLEQQVEMKIDLIRWISEWYFSRANTEYIQRGGLSIQTHVGGKKLKVLLAGHSVGCWVALEMVRKMRSVEMLVDRIGEGEWGGRCLGEVRGGVLLFPTVVDIARSRNGRVAKFFLSIHSSIPHLIQLFAHFLFHILLSATFARWLVGKFTGFKESPSLTTTDSTSTVPSSPLQTTFSFLTSPGAIEQSLTMAREEMYQIGEDTWGEEIWGKGGKYSWALYFGKGDHWVADETREKLIERRGRKTGKRVVATKFKAVNGKVISSTSVDGGKEEGVVKRRGKVEACETVTEVDKFVFDDGEEEDGERWKPEMIVCEEGLPHGFCIDHGEVMAEKTAVWIEDIVEGNSSL